MHYIDISSTKNERIKEVAELLEKSRARRTSGLFVAEGVREITACLKGGYRPESLFFSPEIISQEALDELLGLSETAEAPFRHIYQVSKAVYAKIAYREGSEGVVAVIREKRLTLEEVPFTRNPLILVLESVEKPGNLGALLRTADACGVDAVLVCDPLTDLYNPNLIRASLGGIFTQQVVACTNEEACRWLQARGITILTAQLQDSQWYYDTDMTRPCAIVMGSEANGLTDFWRKVSDAKIRIPMLGELDSLNVSVSAAVLCYEAVRQRNARK